MTVTMWQLPCSILLCLQPNYSLSSQLVPLLNLSVPQHVMWHPFSVLTRHHSMAKLIWSSLHWNNDDNINSTRYIVMHSTLHVYHNKYYICMCFDSLYNFYSVVSAVIICMSTTGLLLQCTDLVSR